MATGVAPDYGSGGTAAKPKTQKLKTGKTSKASGKTAASKGRTGATSKRGQSR